MKKRIPLIVSILFLVTCSIEVGRNLSILLTTEEDKVLFIETDGEDDMTTTQDELLNFDYSIDEFPNAGS